MASRPCITTKNKHRCRVFAVQPQVFRGGRFGVWGTPPPKPLNCKVWENPAGAFASAASHSEALFFPNPNSVALPFVTGSYTSKKPCLLRGKQGFRKICSSLLPAYLLSARIGGRFLCLIPI